VILGPIKLVDFPERTGWDTATKLGFCSPCSVWILEKTLLFFLVTSVLQARLKTMIEWYLYTSTDLYCY